MSSFLNLYSAYSNERLIRILKNRDDYQLEAVEAAKQILSGRNLPPGYIDDILDQLEWNDWQDKQNASQVLMKVEKIMYLIIPIFGLIIWSLALIYYHEKGYKRKKWESAIYMIIGYVIWVGGAWIVHIIRN